MSNLEFTGIQALMRCQTCNTISLCSVYVNRNGRLSVYTICDNCYATPNGKTIMQSATGLDNQL